MTMTTPKRPTTARKHTRTTEEKRTDGLNEGLRIRYGDDVYEVTTGDLTALDTLALRRETGMTFPSLMEAFNEAPDIDLVAIVIWLSRRASGEKLLRYATVAEAITYDGVIDQLDVEDDAAAEPPGESEPAEG